MRYIIKLIDRRMIKFERLQILAGIKINSDIIARLDSKNRGEGHTTGGSQKGREKIFFFTGMHSPAYDYDRRLKEPQTRQYISLTCKFITIIAAS